MRNRYPGRCSCGADVAAREGSALRAGKGWAVWCRTCRTVRAVTVSTRRTGRPRRRAAPKVARLPECMLVQWMPPIVEHDAAVEIAGAARVCSSAYAALIVAHHAAASKKKVSAALRLEADMVELCILGHLGGTVVRHTPGATADPTLLATA